MNSPDPSVFRTAIFDIIEKQMRDGSPPDTKRTYERLVAEGHSHDDTMKMIGCVVTSEIFGTLKRSEPYNEQRYVATLNALPTLPWDGESD